MKAIAVFNNKGGVGKTTLLCNIASCLQLEQQKRVLIIDADPQCNATIYLFNPEQIDSFYNNSTQHTIYNIVHPLKRGKGYLVQQDIPIVCSDGFGVDCIIGDTRFAVLEDFLSSEWLSSSRGEERALNTTFVFKDLVQKLSDQYDYIFFDIGPSLGAINRSVLLACDYFIIPMSSDIFSIKAIENISESLHEWKDGFNRNLAEYNRQENEEYKVGNIPVHFQLKFMGYVNQQYTIKRVEGQARPVKAYDTIIKRIPSIITSKLSEFIPQPFNLRKLALGEIPNLHSLIPLSQSANKPIFNLSGRDGVVGAHFKKVADFKDVICKISEHILTNIEDYDQMAQ